VVQTTGRWWIDFIGTLRVMTGLLTHYQYAAHLPLFGYEYSLGDSPHSRCFGVAKLRNRYN
jgi:hypothetical protein